MSTGSITVASSPTSRDRGKSVLYTQHSIGPIHNHNETNKPDDTAIVDKEQKKGKWHVNAMGSIIYKEHDSYDLMRQIQMGIRISISEITPKKSRELKSKDFTQVTKQDFPNAGTKQTPPHEYSAFVFYSYADMCFRHLRERFGIDAGKFMISVCHDSSLSILGTPGKSGALFFFSQDMKYILKTVTKKESKFLRKILPQYYNHVMANPNTLITRFYGLYSIKPTHGSNVRFIVMNNVFDTQKDVLYRYDLKGSLVGREASEKERSRNRPVLKDIDFLNENRRIRLGAKNKASVIDQMRRDTKFLESVKIMDYSLLLGIHTFSEAQHMETYLSELDKNSSEAEQPLSPQNVTLTTSTSGSSEPQPPQIDPTFTTDKRSSFTSRITFFTNPIEIEKHYMGEEQTKFQKFHGGILSSTVTQDGNRDIYFIGIIDILQQWNNKKQLENLFKGFKYDKKLISSVNPKNYATRFCEFMEKAIE